METLSTNINDKSLKILKKLRIQLGFKPVHVHIHMSVTQCYICIYMYMGTYLSLLTSLVLTPLVGDRALGAVGRAP